MFNQSFGKLEGHWQLYTPTHRPCESVSCYSQPWRRQFMYLFTNISTLFWIPRRFTFLRWVSFDSPSRQMLCESAPTHWHGVMVSVFPPNRSKWELTLFCSLNSHDACGSMLGELYGSQCATCWRQSHTKQKSVRALRQHPQSPMCFAWLELHSQGEAGLWSVAWKTPWMYAGPNVLLLTLIFNFKDNQRELK